MHGRLNELYGVSLEVAHQSNEAFPLNNHIVVVFPRRLHHKAMISSEAQVEAQRQVTK